MPFGYWKTAHFTIPPKERMDDGRFETKLPKTEKQSVLHHTIRFATIMHNITTLYRQCRKHKVPPMKRVLTILFLLLAAGTPASAAMSEEDAAKYRADLDEGISLLRAGSRDEINRSMAKFKAALKIHPESAEAFYWTALAYSDQPNYPRAAENAKNATVYDDKLAEAWLLWGQILLYQKEWRESLNKLETAARLAPEDPMVLYNLGRVYYHGFRDPDNALPKFRSAWQIGQNMRRNNPEMIALAVSSRYYMGCCEYERGLKSGLAQNFESAINAFNDVINEQPNNVDARLRLAMALRKANRLLESVSILQGILKGLESAGDRIDPMQRAEVHLQVADTYLKEPQLQGRNEEFVQLHLQEFVRLVGMSSHPALEAVKEYLDAARKNIISD